MTADEWNALADRVHAADPLQDDGGYKLDGDIARAFGWKYQMREETRSWGWISPIGNGGYNAMPPRYCSSVDDALTTIPTDGSITLLDIEFGWEPSDAAVYPAASARWYPPRKSGKDWHAKVVTAATLALTLTETGLRLRAEQAGQEP